LSGSLPGVSDARATCLTEIAGDAALLVDPLSETAIAEGLEKMWADRNFAQKLVENGRRQREKFSWDRAAEGRHNNSCTEAFGKS